MRALAVLSLLLLGCAPAEATLIVQVRTDLAPGIEFTEIRTTIGESSVTVVSDETRDWGAGVRVAELLIGRGARRLDVAALDSEGQVVVRRPVRVELDAGVRVVTLLLTRDCRGVVCPGASDDPAALACVAGRCVEESCVEEAAGECGPPACSDDAECLAPAGGCALAECSASGSCFVTLNHGLCAADEVCDDLTGACAPVDVSVRAFGSPRQITSLFAGSGNFEDPTLTPDGLEIFFIRDAGLTEIWTSTRPTRDAAWDPPRQVDELVSSVVVRSNPSLSRDGLTLYFAEGEAIFQTTRSARGAPWSAPETAWDMRSANCPSPSADGLELFVCSPLGGGGVRQLVSLTRGAADLAFDGFSAFASLQTPEENVMPYGRIPGGRILYFASSRGDGVSRSIYRTTRAARGATYDTPTLIAELDEMGSSEEDPWVSDDERWIVFTSDRVGGGKELFEAFR